MQETRNNCFRSKKCRTTLLQAKTGKHECRNSALFGTRAYLFLPEEGSRYVFSNQNNCEFLASDGVISVIETFFKMPVLGAPLTSV